ncbi:murein L,D-transpeptidase YcbB/YkuD [Pseudochelatococcus lubricantis]|uniref:Murein L,D-transpeptidase YcbB/YkuD n=1 Tax=Pseudochelatococcus lubricantis TaxID=1538102 RepID=A0ABX0V2B9_9HYPH|nr:L,D-transpeptidase family protein [Pseudochelatococcus lubricantis]NIJ58365.1 murein L,D-transpeptidase YcbB/YkuD [Pseudochelatococcus lubricantis]
MDRRHVDGAGSRRGKAASGRASLARAAATAGLAMACVAMAAPVAVSQSLLSRAAGGADPFTTGSIAPLAREASVDLALPSALDGEARAAGDARDELGLPVPEVPSPVVVAAPDLPTMIGAFLLGDDASRLPRDQREALVGAYEARGFAPFWLRDGVWNEAARSVLKVLGDAGSHGLSPARYRVAEPVSSAFDALAEADIRLSVALVSYARDARGARLDRRKIGTLVMPAPDLPAADAVLAAVADLAADAGAALESYQPRSPQYAALRARLAALKGLGPDTPRPPVARLSQGPTLKIGMRDERVPLIRARLGLSPVDDAETASVYDEKLAEAVAAFQKEKGLPGNGAANRRTVIALAGGEPPPVGARVDTARLAMALRINMERWRWFPHEFGDRYALVNVPEQNVKIVNGDRIVHTTAGIIGKLDSPTPIFSDTMQYIVVNPSWYVPPSIVKNEILPALARDPGYAARRGYEVIRQGGTVRVRQPPGESNALGTIKFMFPNDLAIYLHDTPNRSLFKQSNRALSHGCVRVDNPLLLAEKVLGNGWTQTRLERLIGGKERSIRLETPLPIHLTYFTLRVEPDGKIVTLPDVYGYDQRMKTALEAVDRAQGSL